MRDVGELCSKLRGVDRDLRGARPDEVGEWQHGWQCWFSFVSDANYRKRTMLFGRSVARQVCSPARTVSMCRMDGRRHSWFLFLSVIR